MTGLAQLVNESLQRHGIEVALDPHRLRWSGWFRCSGGFSVLAVPSKPGLFALAEEVLAPGESAASGGRRMLALFQVSETDDLGMTLGRLFLPGNPLGERLAEGRCFARYAVIEDGDQRCAAHAAFQQWIASSSETALGVGFPSELKPGSSNKEIQIGRPAPLPSGF